ncbi:twin-arginine translocase subunit TatC [Agromyces seonyuensis]|uniref:Sec-independent protein translocase protein TatC n=1 Tax=Agromyces seonyuensis TaxID=2662446 RepID=A0A6I4NZG5_9MICO|nr:twin-arginine translocase subunit TatC [Agromyces seonyuensis]MWB97825.1 twin-arginine translocase subunit TatC [Agromyces seonyuensis]
MSLGEHLRELRKRLFIAAIGLVVGMVAGFIVSDWVWYALQGPIRLIAEAQNAELVFPTITGAFDLRLKISLYIGVVVSAPVWLYQIFAFLVPGLTKRERGYVFGFFFSAVPLFAAGCVAAWYVLPHIVELMTSFVPTGASSYLSADYYVDFVLKLMIAVGVAFVVPVFLVLLNFASILSAETIIKSWRIAVLVIALFSAIATPAADVFSMFLLAVPMVVLYFVAWFIAFLHDRRAARKLAQELGTEIEAT